MSNYGRVKIVILGVTNYLLKMGVHEIEKLASADTTQEVKKSHFLS